MKTSNYIIYYKYVGTYLLIPSTLEVDEGKENEELSKQRTVYGTAETECFNRDRYISSTVGKACLHIMLVKNT
jgi:hypothetical protein